jgi:calcineurin-like phosphoesterase
LFIRISEENRLIRPLNYPQGVPGYGSILYPLPQGIKVAVINLSGRVFMSNIDCPFRVGLEEIKRVQSETKFILVVFLLFPSK